MEDKNKNITKPVENWKHLQKYKTNGVCALHVPKHNQTVQDETLNVVQKEEWSWVLKCNIKKIINFELKN